MKILFLFLLASLSFAAKDPCQEVRLADIGWTDVSAKTAVAAELLRALGHIPKITLLSLPVTLASLENNQMDVFLGNWMPSQEADVRPYFARGTIDKASKNLEGAKYTLAVPGYVYEAGVHSFADLGKHASRFRNQIYGIEAGNDGNRQILKIISDNYSGLKGWKLIESSEQGMLTSVKRALAKKEWVVFLGWSPHPMNLQLSMRYLSGADAYFGANYGSASVYTLTRRGYFNECPLLGRFFQRFKLSVDEENELMYLILDRKLTPEKAAQNWIGKHPERVKKWVENPKLLGNYLFSVNNFSNSFRLEPIPLGAFAEQAMGYLTAHFSKQFSNFSQHIESAIQGMIQIILKIPALILILFLSALIYSWRQSIKLGFGICIGLMIILNLGLWIETVQTLVLVLLSTFLSCLLGIPLGILAARNKRIYTFMRPILDLMQTLPTFVYLIPTLMLFGLGIVPGLISTLIFAISAPIRMTHLGLTQVPSELLEVGEAFGASKWQRFWKIEFPSAMPSLLTGLNQCILLSLSMVVIAALVGAEGLGTSVIRALNTVNLKQGFEAGLAIVILAFILDRTLQIPRKTP